MAIAEEVIEVAVLYALATQQVLVQLVLPAGATAGEAVIRSALVTRFPEIGVRPRLARFGRPIAWTEVLNNHDRLDILRRLQVDPKETRKLRAKVQRGRARKR